MRGLYVLGLLLVGCGEELTTEQEYEELRARVTVECGSYAYNYPADGDEPPAFLCGDQPNIACLDEALSGNAIAHLERTYVESKLSWDEPALLVREHHYFAVDGKIEWIAYYELGMDNPGWYRRECKGIAVEPMERFGTTCWHWRGIDCVFVP